MEKEHVRLKDKAQAAEQEMKKWEAQLEKRSKQMIEDTKLFELEKIKIQQETNVAMKEMERRGTECADERILQRKQEMNDKMIQMEQQKEELRIQLLVNRRFPKLQRHILSLLRKRLKEAVDVAEEHARSTSNLEKRETQNSIVELQLQETGMDIEKRLLNLQIMEREFKEDSAAVNISTTLLKEKTHELQLLEKNLKERLKSTQQDIEHSTQLRTTLNIQQHQLKQDQEGATRKIRDVKYFKMTLDARRDEQAERKARLDEQAEELKSNQTDLTTRAEDMESRTIIVSLQEKEIQRKSQTQDDREARLAKEMTDFRQRTGALKEREAIALTYAKREQELNTRIEEQTEREKLFFETTAGQLSRSYHKKQQQHFTNIQKQQQTIEDLRSVLRNKLKKEKQYQYLNKNQQQSLLLPSSSSSSSSLSASTSGSSAPKSPDIASLLQHYTRAAPRSSSRSPMSPKKTREEMKRTFQSTCTAKLTTEVKVKEVFVTL
jgi:hypothetical protein